MQNAAADQRKPFINPRQKKLMVILMIGLFFEGFDDALINIVLPYIAADFHLTNQQVGLSLSVIGFGTMFAFFLVRLADQIGRRPIFLLSIVAYTLCSFVSAFSPNIHFLVCFQFLARIFLIGCWSLGYVIVAEEFESEQRGQISSILQMVAVSGALVLSLLLPLLTALGFNWRAMYVIGALPLVPAIFLRKWLPETQRFLETKKEAAQSQKTQKGDFWKVWGAAYRKYLIVMSLVWFFLYFGVKGSLNFFSLHVVSELSWTPLMVSIALLTQTLAGMIIIVLNGRLIDRLGRRKGAAFILTVGSLSAAALFLVQNFYLILFIGCISAGFTNSFLMVASTITNELFPTEIRANAMAWSNNIIGRMGQVIVPSIVGALALWLQLGQAVAIVVLLPLISLILMLLFIPETKQMEHNQ